MPDEIHVFDHVEGTVTKVASWSDFWKDRYDIQHRKVHDMEDLIARYRGAMEQAIDKLRSYEPGYDSDAEMILVRALNQEEADGA